MSGEFYDFRLIGIVVELGILQEQLRFIEEQMERGKERAQQELAPDTPSDDESDWDMRRQQYEYEIEVILPRTLRNPFLVSMFSVYEAAATEIAALIQKKQGRQIGLNDLRGDFLDRAKKFYKDAQFKLSTNNDRWKRLQILSNLRNVIAHTNGRLEMVAKERRRKIRRYEGANGDYNYLVVSGDFLRETFAVVKDELEDLVARYREWDTLHRKPR